MANSPLINFENLKHYDENLKSYLNNIDNKPVFFLDDLTSFGVKFHHLNENNNCNTYYWDIKEISKLDSFAIQINLKPFGENLNLTDDDTEIMGFSGSYDFRMNTLFVCYVKAYGAGTLSYFCSDFIGNVQWDTSTYEITREPTYDNFIRKNNASSVLGYLPKNNTAYYNPAGGYNPATKKYVDDLVANNSGSALDEMIFYPGHKTPLSQDNSDLFSWDYDYEINGYSMVINKVKWNKSYHFIYITQGSNEGNPICIGGIKFNNTNLLSCWDEDILFIDLYEGNIQIRGRSEKVNVDFNKDTYEITNTATTSLLPIATNSDIDSIFTEGV